MTIELKVIITILIFAIPIILTIYEYKKYKKTSESKLLDPLSDYYDKNKDKPIDEIIKNHPGMRPGRIEPDKPWPRC